MTKTQSPPEHDRIPPALSHPAAARFWIAALLTGVCTGIGAILLTRLLELVQHFAFPGDNLLDAASHASAQRHVLVLLSAGAVTGMGQIILKRLTSGNGIDTAAAIWFKAGRMPPLRTLGSAVLSVIIVGMGVSMGREGAPNAMLGGALGHAWSSLWPGLPPGLGALLGASAVLAATTQGPISSVVLMMELTGRDRSFVLPMLLAVSTATMVARTITPRSIYDARLTDEEFEERRRVRDLRPQETVEAH
jgi:CIC family chloride channel protein